MQQGQQRYELALAIEREAFEAMTREDPAAASFDEWVACWLRTAEQADKARAGMLEAMRCTAQVGGTG